MSDLTTKAAEIRAGLVAELRAACVGHPNASIAWPHRVLHQAAALIEQQAAELAGCEPYLKPGETPRQRMERYHAEVLGLMKLLVQDREKRTTAEAERDELLREKERLGAERDAAWERGMRDAIQIVEQRVEDDPDYHVYDDWAEIGGEIRSAIRARSTLENGPAGLADANSKSPDPNSQSERIAVLEAALREKSKRVEALEGRYEDWKPVSEPPHEVQIERGVLLNFYRDADEGTWWNGTWEERRDADIWCGLVTAGLNDRARAALPQEPAALAPIGEAGR